MRLKRAIATLRERQVWLRARVASTESRPRGDYRKAEIEAIEAVLTALLAARPELQAEQGVAGP